ncbi:MAG: PASTA domain-containing protein [Ruminococcaceae bacterium]|nr:PASTA domain-containing protein [Oscillospiraceae bacterium]
MPSQNQPNPRKSEKIRRANRVIQNRTFVLMLVMGVALFLLLFGKLFELQILRHEELQEKAVDQQTRSEVVTASRGTIYDRNGNVLAISATAETVFLSPKELNEELEDEEDPVSWTKDSLAEDLAKILEVNAESIRQKMDRTDSQYEVVKLRAEEAVANQVREYINEHEIRGIYLVTDAKRYYPYSTLAAHVIGFVGTDNQGLYGLEARYEEDLEGQTGLVVTAKDNLGNDMLYGYEQYRDAQNGQNLVLTIDTTIQYYLEKGIESMVDQFDAANGATGIVMNAKTGAVLGMASYPNYDLNNFSTVTDEKLKEAIADGSASLGDMQLRQWRNKALNDTYEPGSTFKILTLAAALEEGVVDMSTTANCTGSVTISGYRIKCSNNRGHGHQTLKESVGNSCNPAFISYGLSVGNEKFYDYMEAFGLMGTSGIDLDGEATGIFIAEKNFTQLDLACYAFGQNFNVTPIALISAQAACVNGGYLHTPYVVEQVLDDDGKVVFQQDTTPIRQVISEETSAQVRECLEYVVASGTGKNGQVTGYRIGGKTGTADKGQTGDIVVSFLCFAPADDPEIIMLLTMDTPSRTTGTYPSGGNMVAPTASRIMAEILPYLEMEPSYSAEEMLGADATVPNVIGMTVADAAAKLEEKGFGYRTVGDGDTVTDQTPAGSAVIPGRSVVILYAGEEKPTDPCTVPSVVGKTPSEANTAITNAGLLVRFTGTTDSGSSSIRVLSQSVEAGGQVEAGTVITLQLGDTGVTD